MGSHQQRLDDQIDSLRWPAGAFDELYESCSTARELRCSPWEFVKTLKRVKKRGWDPVTFFDPEQNRLLEPNIQMLMESFQMNRLRMRWLLQTHPEAVMEFETEDLKQRIQAYLDLGFSREQVRRMFFAYTQCLGDFFVTRVDDALQYYLDLGLARIEVVCLFEQVPSMLGGKFYEHLDEKIEWMTNWVGIDRNDLLHVWLVKHPRIVFKSDLSTMKENYEMFEQRGFSREECKIMFSELPNLLSGNKFDFDQKITFLVDKLGQDNYREVVKCPVFFTYSYHRRITKRMAFMKLRGRRISSDNLLEVLCASDPLFFRKYAKCRPKEFRYFSQDWQATIRNREAKKEFELLKAASAPSSDEQN